MTASATAVEPAPKTGLRTLKASTLEALIFISKCVRDADMHARLCNTFEQTCRKILAS